MRSQSDQDWAATARRVSLRSRRFVASSVALMRAMPTAVSEAGKHWSGGSLVARMSWLNGGGEPNTPAGHECGSADDTEAVAADESKPETPSTTEVEDELDELEAELEGHAETIRVVLATKRVRPQTLAPPLRLFFWMALGQLLAIAVLVALHAHLGQPITAVVQVDRTLQVPVAILVTVILFLWVAWSFLLGGAIAGHWLLRAPILAVFTYVLLHNSVFAVPAVFALWLPVAVWGWALAASLVPWAARRRALGPRGAILLDRVRLWFSYTRTVPLIAGAIALYFACMMIPLGWSRWSHLASFYATDHLDSMTYFLVPVLFLAGSDLAEMSEAVADRVTSLACLPRIPWGIIVLATAFAGFIIWHSLVIGASPQVVLPWMLSQLVLVALLCGVILAIVRWADVGQWRVSSVPFLPLLVVTLLVGAGTWAWSAYANAHVAPTDAFTPREYAVHYLPAGDQTFSIAFPVLWKVARSATNNGVAGLVARSTDGEFPVTLYIAVVAPDVANISQLVEDNHSTFCRDWGGRCIGAPVMASQGTWQEEILATARYTGAIWSRVVRQQSVTITFVTLSARYAVLAPTFSDVARSWRPDGSATAPVAKVFLGSAQDVRVAELARAFPGLAGLILGGVLLVCFRRTRGLLAVTGLFLVVFGLVTLALRLSSLANLLGLRVGGLGFWVSSIQVALALGMVCAVVSILVRGRKYRRPLTHSDLYMVSALFALACGIQVTEWLYNLFAASIALTFSVEQAVVLVVGMGWDIAMSGKEITNVDGRLFPRHARVLLYLGYMILVATTVLYFSSMSYAAGGHGAADPLFDNDVWPQQGLIALGLPLLLTGFILHASRWWRLRRTVLASRARDSVAAVADLGTLPD